MRATGHVGMRRSSPPRSSKRSLLDETSRPYPSPPEPSTPLALGVGASLVLASPSKVPGSGGAGVIPVPSGPVRIVTQGGITGWQVTLIALIAALIAAAAAVAIDCAPGGPAASSGGSHMSRVGCGEQEADQHPSKAGLIPSGAAVMTTVTLRF